MMVPSDILKHFFSEAQRRTNTARGSETLRPQDPKVWEHPVFIAGSEWTSLCRWDAHETTQSSAQMCCECYLPARASGISSHPAGQGARGLLEPLYPISRNDCRFWVVPRGRNLSAGGKTWIGHVRQIPSVMPFRGDRDIPQERGLCTHQSLMR